MYIPHHHSIKCLQYARRSSLKRNIQYCIRPLNPLIQISRKAYENIFYIIHPFSFKAIFGLSLPTTCNPLLFAYYIYEIKEDFASVIKRTSSTFSNALQNPLILHIFMSLKWKHRHQKYSGLIFVFSRFATEAFNNEI